MSFIDSETISKLIIDKLITNSIIENKLNYVNSKLNTHIEKFIFQMISPLMKSNYFYHETDLDITEQNILFFDKEQIKKINTWETITEPETCLPDRYASKNKLIEYNIKKNDKNILDNTMKENENEQENKNNDKNKYGLNKNKKKYSTKILLNKFLIKNQNIESDENKKEKEKKKELILEIPGIHIPYNDAEKIHILLNDTEENNKLRIDWKFQQIEKEKKLLKEQLKKKNVKHKFLNKDLKIFNPSGLTFDSNGKILKINLQNINNFQNGFITSKTSLKKTKEDFSPIITASQISRNKISKKEIIEYNQEEKRRYNMDFNLNINLENKNINKKKSEKIVLSGSNFEKLNPEIGVIISNDENQKEKKIGGFDYIEKYNKPSMNELSQYLSNSNNNSNINSNSKIASFLNSNSSMNNLDYLGYKEKFNEEKNPLFQNAVHLNQEKKNKKSRNLFLKKDMGNKKSLSNENIFSRNNFLRNSKSVNKIILNDKNININDNITDNYLSSVNNILLSQNFNLPNLKYTFSEENENHMSTDINKIKNKKIGKIKIIKENKSNLIYSLKDLKKGNNNILPNIKFGNNKKIKILGQDYINQFLINTIKKANISNDNFDSNNNDINKENSYKNIFLRSNQNKSKIL